MARPLAIVFACVMAGCTAVPSRAQHSGSRAVVHSEDDFRTTASEASAKVGEPFGTLTLQNAAALALLRNPELAEYSWQVRADEAGVLQAGVHPNPEASVYVEDVLGTGRFHGGRAAQVTLQLSQAIEIGGKRAARIARATESRNLASRDYEVKRVEVLAAVTQRFIELLAAQELVTLAKTNLALNEATLAAVTRRVKAGGDSALDERKARIQLARGRIVAAHAEHQMVMARQELAATWGSATPAFERAEGDLFERGTVPSYEQLTARLAQAPEMLRRLSETRLREAEIRLADTKRVPTPIVAAGIRRLEAPGDEAFVFGVSIPLPVSDRNQGNRSEARALLGRAEEATRGSEVRLRTLLFRLQRELRQAATALDSLQREVVPQAEAAVSFSRRGFVEGRFSYLDVADAERTLAAVRRERLETAASFHRLILEIERVTGEPLEDEARVTEEVVP